MNSSRQSFAKQLRSNMTDAESLLWYHLRGHRLCGMKFKRQQPLGDYIVDFVSFGMKLVLEVDGGQHVDSQPDERRDIWLQGQGFRILRFWNNEVLGETEAVLERILQEITPSDGATSHSTRPPQNGSQVAGYPQPLSHEGRGDKSLERVRWRCRRGLLELDIVLGRFIEQRYPVLDNEQRVVFDELLDLPDMELWDLIADKKEPTHAHQRVVLEWLKEA